MATQSLSARSKTQISLADYRRMIDEGQIGEDDRVELLDGEIVKQMTKHSPHIQTLKRLNRLFFELLDRNYWHHQTQDPVVLETSMPEPDLVVLRGPERDDDGRIAKADDIGLVIEVAESSLAVDRQKAVIYAANNVPHYWIVNLVTRCVEVYGQPTSYEHGPLFSSLLSFPKGEKITVELDGRQTGQIAVDAFLP